MSEQPPTNEETIAFEAPQVAPAARPGVLSTTTGPGERAVPLWAALEIVALVALLIGLFVPEHDVKLWDGAEAWSVFAIVCAIAQLAPFARRATRLDERQAWFVAAVAAGGLGLYWLLIVLPIIGRNTSFAVTLAAAAAGGAACLAPGRPR